MECMVLAGNEARRTALQWQLEDLGADWRCCPAARAEQAMKHLQSRRVQVVILVACSESGALLTALREHPLLAPPWLLGDGFPAPDGEVGDVTQLPERLRTAKLQGRLPALSGLRQAEAERLATGLLRALGVPQGLRAWDFLPEMIALTTVCPELLTDLQHGLYPLTGARHGMTPAAVERSLRLCVESTWTRGSLTSLERFFGSSVDPDRGKPTNREFLCRVQERITLAAAHLAPR